MDYLRSFAEEYGLAEIVGRLAEIPIVQGAILTLDDWWLKAWRYKESGRADEWDRIASRWRWWYDRTGQITFPPFFGIEMETDESGWIPTGTPDLGWHPSGWRAYCDFMGHPEGMPPIRLVVCLVPPPSGKNLMVPELPESRIPLRFEVRPIARLAASQRTQVRPVVGGVSVGTGKRVNGTLGGIVEDSNGQRYGMTCSHIFPSPTLVDQPALCDDAGATSIGMSATAFPLVPCPGSGPCNPYSNSAHISSIDTALVKFGKNIASDLEILSIGPVAGVVLKNSMTPGQQVTFEGRTSGLRNAELGGLAVFYRLQMNGQAYCFRDLFEVRWRSHLHSLLGPVVKAGDSGAWICAETDQGPAWCGQVIGEDRGIGYATFAENTVAAWRQSGKQLRAR